jgi:hypothetical protein
MNTAKRVSCHLPVALRNFCETGCIYREPAFKHLACRYVPKTECAAPCYPEPCPCSNKTDSQSKRKLKYKNEVFSLQEEAPARAQLFMHM